MEIFFEKIENCGFAVLDDTIKKRLSIYADMLVEWNEKINLTAITDAEGITMKHFADCMAIFKYCDIKENASVIDVGTGAGFPGVVMKIVRPDIKLTLLDSLNKRIVFLDELCEALGFNDVTTVHKRAEEGAREKYRESYDFAVARAVANLNVLSEYCLPYVKLGGNFIAMKGQSAAEELKSAEKAIKILGGEVAKFDSFEIEGCGQRGIINIKKISHTPTIYPRISAKISKKPL